jgi:hypothetical protein
MGLRKDDKGRWYMDTRIHDKVRSQLRSAAGDDEPKLAAKVAAIKSQLQENMRKCEAVGMFMGSFRERVAASIASLEELERTLKRVQLFKEFRTVHDVPKEAVIDGKVVRVFDVWVQLCIDAPSWRTQGIRVMCCGHRAYDGPFMLAVARGRAAVTAAQEAAAEAARVGKQQQVERNAAAVASRLLPKPSHWPEPSGSKPDLKALLTWARKRFPWCKGSAVSSLNKGSLLGEWRVAFTKSEVRDALDVLVAAADAAAAAAAADTAPAGQDEEEELATGERSSDGEAEDDETEEAVAGGPAAAGAPGPEAAAAAGAGAGAGAAEAPAAPLLQAKQCKQRAPRILMGTELHDAGELQAQALARQAAAREAHQAEMQAWKVEFAALAKKLPKGYTKEDETALKQLAFGDCSPQ